MSDAYEREQYVTHYALDTAERRSPASEATPDLPSPSRRVAKHELLTTGIQAEQCAP